MESIFQGFGSWILLGFGTKSKLEYLGERSLVGERAFDLRFIVQHSIATKEEEECGYGLLQTDILGLISVLRIEPAFCRLQHDNAAIHVCTLALQSSWTSGSASRNRKVAGD